MELEQLGCFTFIFPCKEKKCISSSFVYCEFSNWRMFVE